MKKGKFGGRWNVDSITVSVSYSFVLYNMNLIQGSFATFNMVLGYFLCQHLRYRHTYTYTHTYAQSHTHTHEQCIHTTYLKSLSKLSVSDFLLDFFWSSAVTLYFTFLLWIIFICKKNQRKVVPTKTKTENKYLINTLYQLFYYAKKKF